MSSEEESCFVNILSQNRSNIVDALLHNPQKAFDKAVEKSLLERQDLDRIKNKECDADKVRECLEVIQGKGENHSRIFVQILHELKVQGTYPRLESWTSIASPTHKVPNSEGPENPVENPEKINLDQNNTRSLYGCNPRLDPNSANPNIAISEDFKKATLTRTKQPYPEHPERFDYWEQVLSSESFSSGRHYWEVDVSLSRSCRIGIALNSMGRKGEGNKCLLGVNPESWCLQKYKNVYTALQNDEVEVLSVPGDPKRFGFLLDCEAGELRCFWDSRVLHVFRGKFTDPVKPAIGVYAFFDDSVWFCSL